MGECERADGGGEDMYKFFFRRGGLGGGGGRFYQFAATMGLARRFSFLDLGFCFTFGREDRFFFFCSSRPIFGLLLRVTCYEGRRSCDVQGQQHCGA